jgi:hypothetical protein
MRRAWCVAEGKHGSEANPESSPTTTQGVGTPKNKTAAISDSCSVIYSL